MTEVEFLSGEDFTNPNRKQQVASSTAFLPLAHYTGIEIGRVKRRPCVDFLHAPGRWLASSGSPRALVPIQTSRLAGEVLEVRVVDLALAYLFIGQGEDVLEPER